MAKKMPKGWHILNQSGYDQIKTLQNAGVKSGMIAAITKRSSGTISVVLRSKSFDDYHRINREYRERMIGKQEGHQVAERSESKPNGKSESYQVELLMILKEINRNLGRLADAWETPPQKHGLFRKLNLMQGLS